MDQIKRINRELVYHGHIVDFYKDTILLPDNRTTEFDFIQHKGAAAIVPVDEDGRVVMVRQYRNALNRTTLEIPAGGLNPSEDMKTCATRECEEETGYQAHDVQHLIDIRTTVAFCNEKIGIYYSNQLTPSKQNLDDGEYVNVEKYKLGELIQMIFDGTIEDSKTISALMAYKAKFNL